MKWFFCLSLFGCLAFSFNACERQSAEVLNALPGAGHHEAGHHEEGEPGGAHAEPAYTDMHSAEVPEAPETRHGETEKDASH